MVKLVDCSGALVTHVLDSHCEDDRKLNIIGCGSSCHHGRFVSLLILLFHQSGRCGVAHITSFFWLVLAVFLLIISLRPVRIMKVK
jgi:hypothetical protein